MQTIIKEILYRSMDTMLLRFERNGEAYPFIDTKFDPVSGHDSGEDSEPFRRRECVYAWIQGRGLESLTRHILRFESTGEKAFASRLRAMCVTVAAQMENLRARNGGRLPFAMHPDGSAFFPREESEANFSDLFYAKGLFAAGRVLERQEYTREGRLLFERVLHAVRTRNFRTDQQSFDPKNPVAFVHGKFPQGARMIALGGLADFILAFPEERFWAETAAEFIEFIFRYHVNTGAYPELRKFDFIESVDAGGRAWHDGRVIFSDPGHALEFVGLTAKVLSALRQNGGHEDLIDKARNILPDLFLHVFDYGFNRKAGGICKGYDLAGRKAVNPDMPWWSLPETVRAGVFLTELYPECCTGEILLRTGAAFQAFCQGFLRESGFACQTRAADGRIINVIPAVPDLDPGYHTNLSLMDVFPSLSAPSDQ